ncbi:MAG: Asp-tRNA(Asn)/Glu-tRNA(Gln) amidotransferase subunit GatB [Gammaproteobacteria bacterium]|nr:MAG: Asp-tRNA(Asn)/Glu-tRNA(Gln) amidotransferase subunit GatB [Gammaproteobacteria bacterium]
MRQGQWETVIGLEIHVQLATRSKLFSGAPTAFGAEPNVQACAIDLGLPGVLPTINGEAVKMAVKFGLAAGATIARHSVFARKNYFYPDLPKGYQISQYELPIVSGGGIEIELDDGARKRINLIRAHLEEDAGKSVHDAFQAMSGIDLNRAGTPLIEIVTAPDLRSAREAVACMRKVHTLIRYLGISDGNMQEGSFRCDANVSLRPAGSTTLGTRTETKNLNSFRFTELAIEHEIERQRELLEVGQAITQETRLYDPERNETRPMRSKEEANDYRYFPDPDLLPLELDPETIETIRRDLPELPDARCGRFLRDYGLSPADSQQLAGARELADYFEAAVAAASGEAKLAANWIMGELTAALNRNNLGIGQCPIDAARLAGLILRIRDRTITGKAGKEVFDAMWESDLEADAIIESRGLRQVTDTGEIAAMVAETVAANPAQAEQYRNSPAEKRVKLIGYFVGQVMKKSRGKADPQQVNDLLRSLLEK